MKNKFENDNTKEQRAKKWRMIALRLAAIFLIIVFLVSECAPLFSGY